MLEGRKSHHECLHRGGKEGDLSPGRRGGSDVVTEMNTMQPQAKGGRQPRGQMLGESEGSSHRPTF